MTETGNDKKTVSKFDSMSIDELEEAVGIYFDSDDLDGDMDDLLAAAGELERKKEEAGDRIDTGAQWERFKRDYIPMLDEAVDEDGDTEEDLITLDRTATESAAKTRKKEKAAAHRVFRTVVAALLVVLLLGATVYALIPEVRAGIVSLVVKTFGNHSVATADGAADTSQPDADAVAYELDEFSFEVPASYTLSSMFENPDAFSSCEFTKDDSILSILIYPTDDMSLYFDSEDAETKQIKIGNMDGYLVTKDSHISIVWWDSMTDQVINLTADKLTEETVINIACSFKLIS